ncbi:MAG: class I SAM-dependent methyltransferase [Planctomycetota bacterium]|nr:class I SAM-dependent methyltransferase [Planctomycetota bacterium]
MPKILTPGRRLFRGGAAVAALAAATAALGAVAGPPGVPTTPGVANPDGRTSDVVEPAVARPELVTPPSTEPRPPGPEEVALIDLRTLPGAVAEILQDPTTLPEVWDPPFDPRERLELRSRSHWFLAVGDAAAVASLRGGLASTLSTETPPIEVRVQVIELARTEDATESTLTEIRRDPSGSLVQALAATPPENARVLAEGRTTLAPGGDERLTWKTPDGTSTTVELGVDPGTTEAELVLRIDVETSRSRTLGRRSDRDGARATDRRRRTSLGRSVATTTAPFAETSVRLIDGSRKTLPSPAPSNAAPVIVVATPEPGTAEDLQTSLPTTPYVEGPASRDGIGRRYFDREIAQVMGHLGAAWLERPEREREERTELLLSLLPVEFGDTVADIGAGSGYFTRRLARLVGPQGRVLATDIQPQMLELLERRLAEEGIENVRPILGTVTDTGLEPDSVDLILLVDVYHEFDHPWEMARSMRRALRPGGRVALVEYRANDPAGPIKPLHTRTAAQSRLEFEAAGFRLEREVVGDLPWQRLQLFVRDE